MRSAETAIEERNRQAQAKPFGSELNSVGFAAVARRLGDTSRSHGHSVPAFRSPPRSPELNRSIRRERDGSATISVRLRHRPGVAVIADMVEGLVKVAEVDGPAEAKLRDDAWRSISGLFESNPNPKVTPLPVLKAA